MTIEEPRWSVRSKVPDSLPNRKVLDERRSSSFPSLTWVDRFFHREVDSVDFGTLFGVDERDDVELSCEVDSSAVARLS